MNKNNKIQNLWQNIKYSIFWEKYHRYFLAGLFFGLLSLIIVVTIGLISNADPKITKIENSQGSFPVSSLENFDITTAANVSWVLFGLYWVFLLFIYFYFRLKKSEVGFKLPFRIFTISNFFVAIKYFLVSSIGMLFVVLAILLGYFVFYYPHLN